MQVAHKVMEEVKEEGKKESKKKEVTIKAAQIKEEKAEGETEESVHDAVLQDQVADTSSTLHPVASSPHVTVR